MSISKFQAALTSHLYGTSLLLLVCTFDTFIYIPDHEFEWLFYTSVCVCATGRQEASEREEEQDTESKTRTPRKVEGKK